VFPWDYYYAHRTGSFFKTGLREVTPRLDAPVLGLGQHQDKPNTITTEFNETTPIPRGQCGVIQGCRGVRLGRAS
jgi:hypothetical protein